MGGTARAQEQFGIRGHPTVELPHHALQLGRGVGQRVGMRERELTAQAGDARHTRLRADDLTEERVRDAHGRRLSRRVDQLRAREPLGGVDSAQADEVVERERLGDGKECERVEIGRVEIGEPDRQQVAERGGHAQLAGPDPCVAPLHERAVVERGAHQLPQPERVAARDVPEPLRHCIVDDASQRFLGELRDLVGRQRLQLDAVAEVVLPERDDGVGRRLTAADRDDRDHDTLGHQPVQQRRRRIVEQVRVVDEQDEAASPGSRLEAIDDRVDGEHVDGRTVRQQRPERAEGKRRRATRRDEADDLVVALALVGEGRREPGLADAGDAREHDPAPASDRVRGHAELGLAPDEGPLARPYLHDANIGAYFCSTKLYRPGPRFAKLTTSS